MDKLFQYINGTRKCWILLTLVAGLMPSLISLFSKGKFDLIQLIIVTLMFIGGGIGTSFFIMINDFLITEKLFRRLKLIDVHKIGDGNVNLVDYYTGWERKLEFQGTVRGKILLITHEFRKGWISRIPYLYITIDPNLAWETIEIKVDRKLTADIISKVVNDALQPTKAISHAGTVDI